MSSTTEVPRAEWMSFCDSFTRKHEGWLVTIEVFGEEEGSGVEAAEMALEGVTADLHEGGDMITVMVGEPDSRLSHAIANPTYVAVKQSEEGADESLCVRTREGGTTLVSFRSPVRTDELDGLPR